MDTMQITTYDQQGRPVFVRLPDGERIQGCCLQSEPCAWHAQHGDEIKREPRIVAKPEVSERPNRKPTPRLVREYLAGEQDCYANDDELYDYLLAKRRQWEENPYVGWVPFIAYMMQCSSGTARSMATWIEQPKIAMKP